MILKNNCIKNHLNPYFFLNAVISWLLLQISSNSKSILFSFNGLFSNSICNFSLNGQRLVRKASNSPVFLAAVCLIVFNLSWVSINCSNKRSAGIFWTSSRCLWYNCRFASVSNPSKNKTCLFAKNCLYLFHSVSIALCLPLVAIAVIIFLIFPRKKTNPNLNNILVVFSLFAFRHSLFSFELIHCFILMVFLSICL